MAAPSWQDIYDLGRYVLQVRRPTMVVNQGDVSEGFIAGAATMVDASIGANAAKFRATYLDGAEDDDLTAEASDRGTDRFQGVRSIGTVTLTRVSTAFGAGTLPAGFTVSSEPDETGAFSTYTFNTPVVWGGLDTTKTVNVTCTLDGPQGDATPGTVTRMTAGDVGAPFDPTITVTNAARFVGGANQESDEDLRARTKGNFKDQVRGTESAVITGAKTIPQVKRAADITDADTGVVTLYVSDASGNSNAAMVAAVEAVMPDWIPIDSIVNVVGADLLVQAIDISLAVRAGTDVAVIIDQVRKSIVSRLNLLNPGETLEREFISAAALAVDKINITRCTVNVPAAAIVPAANQAIRTTTNDITTS